METSLFTKEENFSFWKNLLLVIIFFTIAPVTLGISLFSLYSIRTNKDPEKVINTYNVIANPQSGIRVYASLPIQTSIISEKVGESDARPELVKKYLDSYQSPLSPYSKFIVQTADKYSIDYRLITAISQQESNLCKIIPLGSYNCWGWGITGVSTLGFKSFEEGIDTVSRGLRENYLNKGYVTIDDIMTKYTPQSNGSWANGVTSFMGQMQ